MKDKVNIMELPFRREEHKPTIPKTETTQFYPGKPFEVSHDGENFMTGNFEFIAWHNNFPVIYCRDSASYTQYGDIRNIPDFTANMLEVGEYMIIDSSRIDLKDALLRRLDNDLYIIEIGNSIKHFKSCKSQIKGRKVKVEHKIVEG